jgi:hypothetical protein
MMDEKYLENKFGEFFKTSLHDGTIDFNDTIKIFKQIYLDGRRDGAKEQLMSIKEKVSKLHPQYETKTGWDIHIDRVIAAIDAAAIKEET